MNKVIVISIDAMIYSDIAEFEKLPNFSLITKHKAIAKNIHCIYPTYTYPCHTTIMTGCYPDKHGIYHNEVFDITNKNNKWFWYRKDIKRKTMLDAAKEKGLTTACVSWPVEGAANADYLIAEIWTEKPDEDPDSIFKAANSPKAEPIYQKNKHLLNWMKTPAFDYFTAAASADIIREANPDLMFIHFSYLDHQRHNNGYETEKNINAIKFIDDRLGEVIEAVKSSETFDDTTFILLGDHGHMNVRKVFNINEVLRQKGYITLNEDGTIKDWKIFVHTVSFSGQVYLNGIKEEDGLKILRKIKEEYPDCIERVMTRFSAKEIYHLDGPFSLVLEAVDNVVFGNDFNGAIEREPEKGNYKFSMSSHGFAPEKGANPPFIVAGKRANNKTIEHARLVDEAPTILSIFSLELDDIDGEKLDLIQKEE